MGTLNRGAFLAAAAAAMGIGSLPGPLSAASAPSLAYHGIGKRTRTPGQPQPAGAKLARLAKKRRIGIATIR